MAFMIQVLKEAEEDILGELCRWCVITIGDFSERFAAPIETWNIETYQNQWKSALKSIIEGADKAYLVASMRNPYQSDFISLYSLYREGDVVYIQSMIVLCEGNELPIGSGDLEPLIEDRETETKDGEKISEWKISLDEIRAFWRTRY